jgi:hypothetical protein
MTQSTPSPIAPADLDALRARYRAERDRRIRPDGAAQYSRTTGAFGYYATDPYIEVSDREPVTDAVEVLVIAHRIPAAQGRVRLDPPDGRGRRRGRDLVLEPVPRGTV